MRPQKQLELNLPRRGGKRRGAGRKPKGQTALVSHASRPRFHKPTPVHVTLRVVRRVWNLRSRRCFRVITAAFAASRGRFGLRLIEFSVLGNHLHHLHLVVEPDHNEALSRGMQGLSVRIAKALNRLMGAHGPVLGDHYGTQEGADSFSSAACDRERLLCAAVSWLLLVGWRRARPHRSQLPFQPGLARSLYDAGT